MTQDNGNSTSLCSSTATILFVDLVGSSDAASFMGTTDYQQHLEHFQDVIRVAWNSLFKDLKSDKNNCYKDEIQGDQGFFLFASAFREQDPKDIQNDIFRALKLALSIKYRWQLDENNITQIEGNKRPFEIAIGINSGIVSFSKESSNNGGHNEYKPEGYAINLAKRIEGESRKGTYSRIFVGETTYGLYSDSPGENPVRFKQQELASLKGIAGDIRIYEIAAASIEDEEERAILAMPEEWKTSDKVNRFLKEIKKLFNATQDTWLGNVYCNVKWTQIQEKINEEEPVAEGFLDIIAVARKLVEFDNNFSAWKVHLGGMVLDYFKYSLKRNENGIGLDAGSIALLKDTIDILKALTSSEPYELDARLTLGRFYLESTEVDEETCKELFRLGKHESARSLSIDQFRRIIVWDQEHGEAYYYLAAALSVEKTEASKKEALASKKEALECLNKLLALCRDQGQDDKQIKKIFEEAHGDKLFEPLKGEIEKFIEKLK